MDTRSVVVTNGKSERTLPAEAWKLLASSKEKGSTRKGWTFVRYEEVKAKAKGKAAAPTSASTYIPPEVAAAASAAAAEASMLAGQTVTQEEVLASQGQAHQELQPVLEEQVAPDAQAKPEALPPVRPAPEEPKPASNVVPDDLTSIPNVGPKTASVLNAMGIHTFAQLRDADDGAISNTLKGNGLGVKEALIPHWKKAASEKVQMPA